MTLPATIGDAAVDVLNCALPDEKVSRSRRYAKAWGNGRLAHEFSPVPPDRPGRPEKPELLMPRYMPKRRHIVALLHAIAHIEFNAIDLAWDMVARFGGDMPVEFTDDWVRVADDKARHFYMLQDRESAKTLRIIYDEEISHVHAGQKWFNYLCDKENIEPKQTYQKLVRHYFKGQIKPPFNHEARAQAGFDQDYYLPLVRP